MKAGSGKAGERQCAGQIRWDSAWPHDQPSQSPKSKKGADLPCWLHSSFKTFHDHVGHNQLWKILQETEISDHLICLLRNLYAGQEEHLEQDMEHQTGSKLGKEYIWLYTVTWLI